MKIALCQINPTVGDIAGNAVKIVECSSRSREAGADVAVFPELSLIGYPPRDLLIKKAFLADQLAALKSLAARITGITAVVGFASESATNDCLLYNSAAVIEDGVVKAVAHKRLLPTYDVFDEERYFCEGEETLVVEAAGGRVGVTICEDAWNDADFWKGRPSWSGKKTYGHDPLGDAARAGADVIVNLSASPYSAGKEALRREMLAFSAAKHGVAIAFVNQAGGNDELVFDGRSLGISREGKVTAACEAFAEDMAVFDTEAGEETPLPVMEREEEIFRALVLGTRDYAAKCGFTRSVIGLSGGIDSSLVAAIAAAAMGAENVTGVLMPSMYSSEGSVSDAEALAQNLGISTVKVPIADIYGAFVKDLAGVFKDTEPDVTEENIQARIRGVILMAISNKFGGLLLSTGNKSEVSVGYCTLYGDMAGGLDVIGDVLKTDVYAISRWMNRDKEVIPEAVISKPPSAELRPGQRDDDSLPPYDVLDTILRAYVEEERSPADIAAGGLDSETVLKTVRLVDSAEYKRKQAAPVLKVSGRAFGFGRRMPIAQGYRQTAHDGD